MTISAKIVADSVAPHGGRITTLQLRYQRFIHAEFLTHREFSRNASSSRAIPVAKLIEAVERDPARPIHWGKNQPGMQAVEQLNDEDRLLALGHWDRALRDAVHHARNLALLGVAKQVVNRILEPFAHIDVVVTSTSFRNFLTLRDHPDAQPEIRELARAMRNVLDSSVPTELDVGQWHTPYVTNQEYAMFETENGDNTVLKISAARCARVSYLKHDQTSPSIEDDLKLYERLVGGNPKHASPTEHQATPLGDRFDGQRRCRNFVGWWQYRASVEGEAQ